ncbi:hypothetical protein ACQP1W_02215 [Spirillospora sp. CA-255316]
MGDDLGVAGDLDHRARLRDLVPSARVRTEPVDGLVRRLAEVPADALADLVLDGREPWWRRMACARALTGRVPDGRSAALVGCVRDDGVTTEIRRALLGALSVPGRPHSEELLAWLRARDGGSETEPYDLDAAIALARAELGDLSAARRLALLAADPWTHRRKVGERAVDVLVESQGLEALLGALGAGSPEALAVDGASPADRLLGVRLAWRSGGDVTPALADASTMVARKAYELLGKAEDGEDGPLLAMVQERRPGHLWALAVLHRRGHSIRSMWEALGSPRIELPGVPPDVREAIVRQYTPGQRDTDPRWLVEAAVLEPVPDPWDADFVEERLDRAVEALAAADLDPQEPVAAGEHEGTGSGTYDLIKTRTGWIMLSTLGPFFAGTGADQRAITALRAAGFHYIDPALAEIRFEGLHVYFFGDREPLTIKDLLFYWQD